MSEIKNKIITISGEPASGKSTVVKMLKEKYEDMGYNVHVILTGHIFREIIIQEYLKMYPDRTNANLADIQTDETFAAKRGEIDGLIDEQMAKKGEEINSQERPNDVYIIDSRLAWHNIPQSYAVRLTVDEGIAGKRVFGDKSRGCEDVYKNEQEATEKTKQRKLGEIERYKERYGLDLSDPENYNLIVDTSFSNTEELADILIEGEEEYRKGHFFPKTWASPLTFLSEQKARSTYNTKIDSLVKNINENGFDPFLGMVAVAENEGIKILLDGNHRVCARLSTGKTLVPYEVTRKNDSFSQSIANMIYDDPTLECVYDWADIISWYGGNIGKIQSEQIKDLKYLKNVKTLKDIKVQHLISVHKVPKLKRIPGLEQTDGSDR